jgi:kumamolisin
MDAPDTKDLLTAPAPDSLVARYGLLAMSGIENTPAGMWHAAKEDFYHPLQTVGMVAGAAAVGALVKTVLPQCGVYGKLAGVAIGAYVTYRAAEPVLDSLTIAGQAKTKNDIEVAGKLLGDVAGSFAVNSAISGLSYKLGGMAVEKYFPNSIPFNSNSAGTNDGGFWSKSVTPRLPGAISVTTASSGAIMFEPRLAGIERFSSSDPISISSNLYQGQTDANSELSITVQLKSKASDKEMDQVINDIATGKRPNMSDKEFADKFGATPESLDNVKKFAESYGLKVSEADLRSGRVVLTGSAKHFSEAFRTQLYEYKLDGMMVRDRSGALFVPKSVGKDIEGVYGLDNLPQASPRIITEPLPTLEPRAKSSESSSLNERTSYRADEVAKAYNFPTDTTGKGQAAAIVELGGGIDLKNEADYYKNNGLKQPDINVIKINGAKALVGSNSRADSEVSLDSQVLGTLAPDAKQNIIFTSNSEQGFIDAVARGAFPADNEIANQAMSISWGQPSENMSDQGKRGLSLALKKAALKGMSVFVAAGDDGAGDNVRDGKLHVDFPASDPFVTAVGGTRLDIKDGKIEKEVVWNDNRGSSGGGISALPVPEYQSNLQFAGKAITGRGEPDITGNASPNSGYRIHTGGNDVNSGGTSAVAPLYTALALRLNEGLGGGDKTVGFMNPFLYQQALSGKANFFNDIVQGTNNGYDATKSWDPASGWGSLDGQKLLDAYKQAGK